MQRDIESAEHMIAALLWLLYLDELMILLVLYMDRFVKLLLIVYIDELVILS